MNFKFLHSQELPVASSLLKIPHVFQHPFIHLFHQILQIRSLQKLLPRGKKRMHHFQLLFPPPNQRKTSANQNHFHFEAKMFLQNFNLLFQNCFSKILLRNNLLSRPPQKLILPILVFPPTQTLVFPTIL